MLWWYFWLVKLSSWYSNIFEISICKTKVFSVFKNCYGGFFSVEIQDSTLFYSFKYTKLYVKLWNQTKDKHRFETKFLNGSVVNSKNQISLCNYLNKMITGWLLATVHITPILKYTFDGKNNCLLWVEAHSDVMLHAYSPSYFQGWSRRFTESRNLSPSSAI